MNALQVQRIVLPAPPSSNRYWRHDRGTIHVSSEGLAYRNEVRMLCRQRGLLRSDGDVVLRMTWYRKAKRGDLDNRLKQVLDALQGQLYANDSQIVEIRFRRREDKADPRLEVECAVDGTIAAEILMCEAR